VNTVCVKNGCLLQEPQATDKLFKQNISV